MKHFINPQVDCVFKAILGAEEHKHLLLDFLNAIVKPNLPLLNPYNEREFTTDKLSVVDIKAKDAGDNLYQIEVQIAVFPHLPSRIAYTWCDIYGAQLKSGGKYNQLCPVISIWLLGGVLFNDSANYHHHFQLADIENRRVLTDHCSIHVIELEKWQYHEALNTEDKWLYFFKDAKGWTQLPDILDTPEMRQAMAILQRFSEKDRDYHLYQARENAIREEKTQLALLEEAQRNEKEALRKQEEAVKKQEEALKEQERLRRLLKKSGIDPDSSRD